MDFIKLLGLGLHLGDALLNSEEDRLKSYKKKELERAKRIEEEVLKERASKATKAKIDEEIKAELRKKYGEDISDFEAAMDKDRKKEAGTLSTAVDGLPDAVIEVTHRK